MHVISGTLKGRVINQSTNSRPTTNYCKQVLFNLLSNNSFVARDIASSRVLDGFCGTGAIGFEFLSRGAMHVDFIDNNKQEIKSVLNTLSELGIANASATCSSFPKINKIDSLYDIIYLDPPYTTFEQTIYKTIKNCLDILASDGMIILELMNKKQNEKFVADVLSKICNIILDKQCNDKTRFIFLTKC